MPDKKKKHPEEPVREDYGDEVSEEEIDKTVSEIESADTGGDKDEKSARAGTEEISEEEGSGTDYGPEDLQDELDRARAQSKEMYERYLRSVADLDNFKKRVMKETEENRKYANEELIKSLIPTVDNLERALAHSEGNSDASALVEGIKMVHKQFMDTLAKFGVEQIVSLGRPFDPNFHQALMQVKTNDSPPNTVVSEVTKGYLLNGRLVRPAMVGVSAREDRESAEESPWGDEEYREEEDVPD
jgi:molecular chaperone GrpE